MVRFISISGMKKFQCFPDTKDSLVDYFGVFEISNMIISPSVSSDIRANFKNFYVSDVFLFFFLVKKSSFTNVAPRTIGARGFIHDIGLKFDRRPKLGGKEFLLQDLARSSKNINQFFRRRLVRGSVTPRT